MASGSEKYGGVNQNRKAGSGKPSAAKRRRAAAAGSGRGSGSRRTIPRMDEIF